MTPECPKCKSPVAREGQRFCYRCGQDLTSYYDSLNITVKDSGPPSNPLKANAAGQSDSGQDSAESHQPQQTKVLASEGIEATTETVIIPAPSQKALLRILLPTGDVFDREIQRDETQMGKGPRNDIVIADPAVSSAHALIISNGEGYTVKDLSSRNGTFVNGERISEPRLLRHGDVIGLGLSKLTFRLSDQGDTGLIQSPEITAAILRPGPPPLTQEELANAISSAGLVPSADVQRLLDKDEHGRRLYRAIVEDHLASEESLQALMSRRFQLPKIDLKAAQIDQDIASKLSSRLARNHQLFAAGKEGEKIVLAVADPTDKSAIEEATRELGMPVEIQLATASDILEQVDRWYGPRLIGVLPTGEKLEYFVNRQEIEIGKAAHNQIVLNDPTVSNTHAILIARGGGYAIVDLGSRNGTYINGERLGAQAHTLRHGDSIQLGQTLLTFRNRAETKANVTATLSVDALADIRKRAEQMDTSAEKALETSKPTESGRPAESSRPAGASPVAKVSPGENVAPVALPVPESIAPAGIAPEVIATGEPMTEEEKEKKKKKKKKKGDDRLKAAYISGLSRIVAQILAVVLSVGLALYIAQRQMGGDKPKIETNAKGKAKLKFGSAGAGTALQGDTYEASGVVAVPGTDGVLFVDDGRPGEALWMQLNASGNQNGPIKSVSLGASVEDPEGITYDGSYFYIVGSQSSIKAGAREGLARFSFDPATQTAIKVETISGLRDFLINNVPELKSFAGLKGEDGGLNIEGIAWDPDPEHQRLMLGLRSPLINGNALIVPIRLRDPNGAFTIDNLQLAEPNAIQLPLGGLGIRDIQYDSRLKSFLVISGAPEHHEKTAFTLWEWNGDTNQSNPDAKPREETTLDAKMKPEGVSRIKMSGREMIFIVGDASSYFKLDYSEGQ
jgi:pSer/pThr/pTyr-binding forkhead associated (FHA) protein